MSVTMTEIVIISKVESVMAPMAVTVPETMMSSIEIMAISMTESMVTVTEVTWRHQLATMCSS
jgi:hypothetical protein